MNILPLQSIFDDIAKNNIIVNLENDTYCHSNSHPGNKFIIPDKNIGYIYSKSSVSEIMNNLIEEGSAIITYSYILTPVIKEEIFKKLLHSFFIKCNFHIKFIPSQKNTRKLSGDFEIVITENDIQKSFIEKWISDEVVEDVADEVADDEIDDEVPDEVDEVDDEVDEVDEVDDEVPDVDDEVDDEVQDEVDNEVDDEVGDEVDDEVDDEVQDEVDNEVEDEVGDEVEDEIDADVHDGVQSQSVDEENYVSSSSDYPTTDDSDDSSSEDSE